MSTDPQTSVTVEPDAVEGVGAAPTATARKMADVALIAAWFSCVVLTIGGALTLLAGFVLLAWLPSDVIPLRLCVTGWAAFIVGGVPWLVAVS